MIQYQIDTPGHNTGQRPTQKTQLPHTGDR
jgi:hypothetical protein